MDGQRLVRRDCEQSMVSVAIYSSWWIAQIFPHNVCKTNVNIGDCPWDFLLADPISLFGKFSLEESLHFPFIVFNSNVVASGTSRQCTKACLPHGSRIHLQCNVLRKFLIFFRFILSPPTRQQCSGMFLLPRDKSLFLNRRTVSVESVFLSKSE